MAIVANGSNYLAISAAILSIAEGATWTATPAATRNLLLPFPDTLGATPDLTVRYPQFQAYGNPRTLQPVRGSMYSRIQGGTGRFFIDQYDLIILYDYRPDSTASTTVAQALADLRGPQGLEVTFQENPQLLDANGNPTATESRVIHHETCNAQKYGIAIAGRPLWMALLRLEVADQQSVDYNA